MRIGLIIPAIALSILLVQAGNADSVTDILKDVDQWIISDTARIMSYIDSCNEVTAGDLKSSPLWDDAYRDLSFLLGIDYISDPQIDSTGRIYFLMRLTGQIEHLFYMDKPMGWFYQLTPNNWSDEGYSIYYFEVHPSGDYVLVGAMKYGSEKHDIFMFNRNGSSKPLLVDPTIEYSNVIFKNKDEFLLMVATDTSRVLSIYNISSGELKPLYSEDEWVDIYDYENGLILCERWFSFSESQIFTLDEKTLKVNNITGKGYFDFSRFTGDGRILTVTNVLSNKDEFNKLALFDLKKPDKIKAIFTPEGDIDRLEYIKPIFTGIMVLNTDGYSELAALDIYGNRLDMPQTGVGVISSLKTNDYGGFVYSYGSPNAAPAIYKSKIGAAGIEKVAAVSTFGFDFSDIKVELIHYRSKDGTMIPAFLYLPPNARKDGSSPAIVEYHGGPPGQSRPHFQRNIAFAMSRGFIMMFPNVRGSTGYGSAWEMADNLEGRYDALADCIAALDYLVESGYSNPEKIGIWGGSYGGYVVNYLSVTVPEKFACAVSEVGEADMDYSNTHGDITFLQGWEREYGPVNSRLTHDLSPVFKAENIGKPMLITAGFNDPRVFAGDPRRWGCLLNRLGKDILYYEEVSTGHWGTTKTQVIDSYAMAYVYFMEHLMK
jgi:dienelactone hydrolase